MKRTIIINNCPEQQGWNKNTELCVDVKTYLRGDARMRKDKNYQGVLTRDSEVHMTFVETSHEKREKRNPHIYEGEFITVTKRNDGSYRPNFRPVRIDKGFDLKHYVSGVGLELLWALEGLVEKSEE
jgi:hypothetical protein